MEGDTLAAFVKAVGANTFQIKQLEKNFSAGYTQGGPSLKVGGGKGALRWPLWRHLP